LLIIGNVLFDEDGSMAISRILFSSRSDEWPTPRDFFAELDAEFDFTLDPCATSANATCPRFFSRHDDGLRQDWGRHRVFCNPPYGRSMRDWGRKCFESARAGALVVLLAHARTDTRWFHDWVYGKADEIRFVRGRLRFGDGRQSAPFPSLVAIYRPPQCVAWPAREASQIRLV
jgi:site-specific DNA-methyltransferase (adenine-specific)